MTMPINRKMIWRAWENAASSSCGGGGTTDDDDDDDDDADIDIISTSTILGVIDVLWLM